MCIIYIMYIHIIPTAKKFAMELGSGYNILLLLFECIMYKQVFRVKKLMGLPPQLELLALALNCWLG